jgi:hypothetical protein
MQNGDLVNDGVSPSLASEITVQAHRGELMGKMNVPSFAELPGDLILLISWKDAGVAQAYEDASAPNDKARVRKVRIVRDYGKYDRREAPQYYADAKGGETLHA